MNKDFRNFIENSETFNGFVFSGCFSIYEEFLKMYEVFQEHGVNLLDDYAKYTYFSWKKITVQETINYENCDRIQESLSRLRKYKIVDPDDLSEQRCKLKEFRNKYTQYLESINNRERIQACIYTNKKEVKQQVFELHGSKCLRCDSDINISIDHIIPVFHGGTNHIDNLQPLCKSCNSSKGTKTIDYRKPKTT